MNDDLLLLSIDEIHDDHLQHFNLKDVIFTIDICERLD